LVQAQEDSVHSLSDPVSQSVEVLVSVSNDGVGDFVDNFNVVNQDALSDGVDERSGVSESVSKSNELLDFTFSSLAVSGSLGKDLDGLAEEGNTFLNFSGVLGLDISNTGRDVLVEGFTVGNAGLDVVEDGGRGDTVKETSGEVEDLSSVTKVLVLSLVESESEVVSESAGSDEAEN